MSVPSYMASVEELVELRGGAGEAEGKQPDEGGVIALNQPGVDLLDDELSTEFREITRDRAQFRSVAQRADYQGRPYAPP